MYVFESIHLDEFLYLLIEKHMANSTSVTETKFQ